jgi:hypothetical protein
MNTFLNGMKAATNYTYTENGAITHRSTLNPLMDLFAMGGSYRKRSDENVITLFKSAFEADEAYGLKCLFYLRDVRGGQGERRFFRVCAKWLANAHTEAMRRNLIHVPEFGRWDDLFVFIGTSLERDALDIIKHQLALDVQCKTPSLLAKWMPSENTSSAKTVQTARVVRKYLNMTPKQYRKTLSILRTRINVLERLMSEGRWDEIEFDKIPSKAGLKYKNAFARHDIERMKSDKAVQSYADFAKDTTKKVNADVLNPVDIANKIFSSRNYYGSGLSDTDRAMLDKYWTNLKDYYNGREENGIAICDVSGSMWGQPLNAAVSMSAYIAERGKGPFKNHFITFSSNPQLVEFKGVDITDKFLRAEQADWGGSTNVEAALDLMLNVALKNHTPAEDMPKTLYIFSDMEFNGAMTCGPASIGRWNSGNRIGDPETLFESIAKKWAAYGYELPRVIFWNLDARQDNIPALNGRFGYVSGFSMNMVETILSGKDGLSLVLEKLDSERYAVIH